MELRLYFFWISKSTFRGVSNVPVISRPLKTNMYIQLFSSLHRLQFFSKQLIRPGDMTINLRVGMKASKF